MRQPPRTHLPSRLYRGKTACGRDVDAVLMADEPDEGHSNCIPCMDDWRGADVNGDILYEDGMQR